MAYKNGYPDIVLSEDEKSIVLHKELNKKRMAQFEISDSDDPHEKIELTEIEKEKALYGERMRRQGDINLSAHWNSVKSDINAIKFDYNQTKHMFEYEFMKTQGRKFEYDESNSSIMDQLFRYFSNDKTFKGDLSKGIMLIGNVGCGKSAIMESFKSNSRQSYIIDSCRKISFDFSKNGFDNIEKFTEVLRTVRDRFGFYERGHCFDDFGAESIRKHYGDTANVMEEILTTRYDMRRHNMTHCTTNLTGEEIEEIYGQRLKSRFYEMFNTFVFVNSIDRRKK